ncbi:hypothetical protein BGZ96_005800 [Linnemannia gamsii]|uniref:Uncharacterized protein n=1 Tax=Linnemannia gamsii TaxID=64522 RepID=A0ABQ7K3G8_9FUNG|nr:hypothetical protein BGZ96_005800 [Linnemannia gamsii]
MSNSDIYSHDDHESYSDDSDGEVSPHVDADSYSDDAPEGGYGDYCSDGDGESDRGGDGDREDRSNSEDDSDREDDSGSPRNGGRDREENGRHGRGCGSSTGEKEDSIHCQEHIQSTSGKNRPSSASSDVFERLVTAQLCTLPIQTHTSWAKRLPTQDPYDYLVSALQGPLVLCCGQELSQLLQGLPYS